MRIPAEHVSPKFLISGIILIISLLSCNFPSQLERLNHTSTSTIIMLPGLPTQTLTPTITSSPTETSSPTSTLTPSSVPTRTPTRSYTPTRTKTPIPASLTPGPGQMTSGQNVWTLVSINRSIWINIKGYDLSPVRYRHQYLNEGMIWLVAEFECTTRQSLTDQYLGRSSGVTLLSKRLGYPDVYLLDSLGNKFQVTFIGDCWLAAPVKLWTGVVTLHFQNLPPFLLRIP